MNSEDIIDWEMLLKLVTFLMFLSSYSFCSLSWFFPRTCPGRCDALQSWICLQGWSSSLLLMLKSEPNRLFKMSWTKSKLPVSLQSGKTELFWCKFTLISSRKCHQIIIISTLCMEIWSWMICQFHTPWWEKNPNISVHCLSSWTLTGESWNLEDFRREHFPFNNVISPSCDHKSKSVVRVCVLIFFFHSADSCTELAD